ncbi:cytochrome P450 family protein [Ceratobasidium sp. AG-Ba]|nr:cytochrome P450 family protein [Ceratobasidium sp. AG-Ba]QRW02450.1 cytochrome P450 family protein [Ceratobasidium sp. AG-Ba]
MLRVTDPAFLAPSAVVVALALYKLYKAHSTKLLALPPGPPSYPLIGQLLSMPLASEHTVFEKLGKEIGNDVIALSMLGNTIVVLNSAQAATDLLEKRSSIYSDRTIPPMVLDSNLMDWGKYPAILPYGDRWKEHRRMMHAWLQKNSVRSYRPSQEKQTRMLLVRLLTSSAHLQDELYRTVAATLLRTVYGYQLEVLNDPFVVGARTAIDNLARAATATNFLVNGFPALAHVPSWFPGTKWKQTARSYRQQKDDIMNETFDWTKQQIARGSNEPSIVRALLENDSKAGLSQEDLEDYIKHIAIALFGAGSDTTVASLEVFVIAMIRHPEVQAKAQAEIDRVVGTKRLPSFEDQTQLPYIDQIIKEVMRWQPVTPLAVPHTSIQDDVYREYRIPKGSIVIGNVWAMSRNEIVYPDPETFNPDRFSDPAIPPVPAFGFGRRLCPGMYYADASIFIAVASILATYKITPAKDANGKDVLPSTEGVADSVVYHPKPFTCVFTPRSEAHRELILSSV